MMDDYTNNRWSPWVRTLALALVLIPATIIAVLVARRGQTRPDDAYVLTKPGAVTALWQYKQLRMDSCMWCGRTVNLNRHHIVPQSANPALRDVKENLIVLCRDCHFVLGHRCDWKRYNPDVLYICTHFTNCVRSSDTRYAVTNRASVAVPIPPAEFPPPEPVPVPPASYPPLDATPVLHVTNDVPEKQRTALERILKCNQRTTAPEEDARTTAR